jgi:hypothetical protein
MSAPKEQRDDLARFNGKLVILNLYNERKKEKKKKRSTQAKAAPMHLPAAEPTSEYPVGVLLSTMILLTIKERFQCQILALGPRRVTS